VKQSIVITRYRFSFLTPWEGPCYIDGYQFKQGPDIALMHLAPIPGLGGHGWLHWCRTASTTSQHRFFPRANSTLRWCSSLYSLRPYENLLCPLYCFLRLPVQVPMDVTTACKSTCFINLVVPASFGRHKTGRFPPDV
jgi:hypothetical protein